MFSEKTNRFLSVFSSLKAKRFSWTALSLNLPPAVPICCMVNTLYPLDLFVFNYHSLSLTITYYHLVSLTIIHYYSLSLGLILPIIWKKFTNKNKKIFNCVKLLQLARKFHFDFERVRSEELFHSEVKTWMTPGNGHRSRIPGLFIKSLRFEGSGDFYFRGYLVLGHVSWVVLQYVHSKGLQTKPLQVNRIWFFSNVTFKRKIRVPENWETIKSKNHCLYDSK